MSEPTTPVVQEHSPAEEPRAAVIEIVEQHKGEKKPYTGTASIIVPNHLRINGVAVWATYDAPATIREVVVDGAGTAPFSVTVSLLARALSIGGTPAFDEAAEGDDVNRAAVVEIPDLEALEPGAELTRPYVLLNGHRLYVEGPVGIGALSTDGQDRTAAMVTFTLLCRRLLVDDEPAE